MNSRTGKTLTGLLLFACLILPASASASEYNFGDGSTKTLTAKAWNALQTKDFTAVEAYADYCLSKYSKKALEQQASLPDFAPNEEANNYWALNDVGTSLFIKGEVFKRAGENKKAKTAYQELVNNYFYAQCWDPNGWFWKPADAAQTSLDELGEI